MHRLEPPFIQRSESLLDHPLLHPQDESHLLSLFGYLILSMGSLSAALQAEPDNATRSSLYRVGIRFSPLGNINENSDRSVSSKHWCLVFTPANEPGTCRTVQAFPNIAGKVAILDRNHNEELPYFLLADYHGTEEDVERALEAHPARGSTYSACFNNCQHFAAIFLLFLQTFANGRVNKCFRIVDTNRMQTVQSVLVYQGLKVHNNPNPLFEFGTTRLLALSTCGVASLAMAAEATVTYTVPASGIAGWFGATTSVVVPAAYASAAAISAQAVAVATIGAGGAYWWRSSYWKKQTRFNDPRFHGFPEGELPPLTPEERMQKEDMESKDHLTLFGRLTNSHLWGSSAKVADGFTAGVIDALVEEEEKERNARRGH